jgi:hypothetical protein
VSKYLPPEWRTVLGKDIPEGEEPPKALIIPDLILHRRGEAHANLLAAEVKVGYNTSSDHVEIDLAKLRGYQEVLGYTYAVMLVLSPNPSRRHQWQWMVHPDIRGPHSISTGQFEPIPH